MKKSWTWGDFGDDRISVDGCLGDEKFSFDLTTRWPDHETRERAIRFAEAICAAMNARDELTAPLAEKASCGHSPSVVVCRNCGETLNHRPDCLNRPCSDCAAAGGGSPR